MRSILVIQTAFLGDIILTTPFLQVLNEKWPDAHIDVLTTAAGAEALRGLSKITCHSIDKKNIGFFSSGRFVQNLFKSKTFDWVFCVHRSPRSLWMAKSVDAKNRVAFESLFAKVLKFQTVPYPEYSNEIHYSDKPLALLKAAGFESQRTPKPRLVSAPRPPDTKKYAVLSPFSVWPTKMWFSDRFANLGIEIARKYDLKIYVTGTSSPKERTISKTIVEKIKAKGLQAETLAGETSLEELKALIQGAALVVANDSAPVHIASAFNIPTVAVFGPTVKSLGFFPLSQKSTVVERPSLECRPCGKHGHERCPKRHFKCMNEIQVSDVVAAVEKVLL